MKNAIIGFSVGVILGGVVAGSAALLLTDRTGSERRKDLEILKRDAFDKMQKETKRLAKEIDFLKTK